MQEESIDANAVIDRMRGLVGARTDLALCRALGLGTSTVSTWRLQRRVPFTHCVSMAVDKGVSLDWLLLGIGPRELGAAAQVAMTGGREALDPRAARMIAFIRRWEAGHDGDRMAWLEQTLVRNVQEYGEWLATQPRD